MFIASTIGCIAIISYPYQGCYIMTLCAPPYNTCHLIGFALSFINICSASIEIYNYLLTRCSFITFSITTSHSSAILSKLNISHILLLYSAKDLHCSGFLRSFERDSAKESVSPQSTKYPFFPFFTNSSLPERRVETIGKPTQTASIMELLIPS